MRRGSTPTNTFELDIDLFRFGHILNREHYNKGDQNRVHARQRRKLTVLEKFSNV